jgi:hypothetical protein
MHGRCPHCDAILDLSPFEPGARINCGNCSQVFLTPSLTPVPPQTGLSVSNSSQSENWTYEPIVSDLDDSVLHTFRTTSISGTDKYGHPIDLFVRFGNNTIDILIDWKGTCFADAHSTFGQIVSMRCGSAKMGVRRLAVTNDLTGTILTDEPAYYCVRSFFAIEKAVFSVTAYHDNRIDAVFDVSGLFQAIQSTVPNPEPGVLPVSRYPQLAKLPATVDHGWVTDIWLSRERKKEKRKRKESYNGRLAIFLLVALIAMLLFYLN